MKTNGKKIDVEIPKDAMKKIEEALVFGCRRRGRLFTNMEPWKKQVILDYDGKIERKKIAEIIGVKYASLNYLIAKVREEAGRVTEQDMKYLNKNG